MPDVWQQAWDAVDLGHWGTVCHEIQRKPFDEQMKALEGLARKMHIQGWNARDPEVARLRACTHEIQERADKEVAHWRKRAEDWDRMRHYVDDLLREDGVAYQSAAVRAGVCVLLERAEIAEAETARLRAENERLQGQRDGLEGVIAYG